MYDIDAVRTVPAVAPGEEARARLVVAGTAIGLGASSADLKVALAVLGLDDTPLETAHARILRLRAEGVSVAEIAERYGWHKSSIHKLLGQAKILTPP